MTTLMTELAPAMTLYCPDFTKRFGPNHVESAMREYASQLFQRNMRLSDVRRGIERMKLRTEKWTPTPTEFIELCKLQADDFGFPSVDQALKEIDSFSRHSARGSSKPFPFSSTFTELIARDIANGMFGFRRANDQKREAMVEKSYLKWLEYQRTHGFLPEPLRRISEDPASLPITPHLHGQISGTDYSFNRLPESQKKQIERIKQARQLRKTPRRGRTS